MYEGNIRKCILHNDGAVINTFYLSTSIKIIDINGKDITKRKPSTYKCLSNLKNRKEIVKGVWRMPRLSEATKDVVSCEKLGGLAHTN